MVRKRSIRQDSFGRTLLASHWVRELFEYHRFGANMNMGKTDDYPDDSWMSNSDPDDGEHVHYYKIRTIFGLEIRIRFIATNKRYLCVNLLEIKQHTPNNGINYKQGLHKDYSQDFSIANNLNGGNNIYVSKDGSLSPPSIRDKYIAGHAGSSSDIKNGYMNPGSYNSKENNINNFEYVLDYRILPNIPVLFSNNPHVKNNSFEHLTNQVSNSESNGERTKFSMNIVYVLLEDQ